MFDQDLEVTECAVRLSDDQAPYGAIREDSGQLILNARNTPLSPKIWLRKRVQYKMTRGQWLYGDERLRWRWVGSHKPDALEIVKLDDESLMGVMMLEFSGQCSEYQWSSRGRVRRVLEGRAFSRVGVFEFIPTGMAGKVKEVLKSGNNKSTKSRVCSSITLRSSWRSFSIRVAEALLRFACSRFWNMQVHQLIV